MVGRAKFKKAVIKLSKMGEPLNSSDPLARSDDLDRYLVGVASEKRRH